MGSWFWFTLILLSFTTFPASNAQTQKIKSAQTLDLAIRDYTFSSYHNNFKTGELHRIDLPGNLSSVSVGTIRLRCGSLQKHGARINEFHLSRGITVHPCNKRVILVTQNLGSKWSSVYFDSYQFQGYQLISPVLGLSAYNAVGENNSTIPSELVIQAGKDPITIDFATSPLLNMTPGIAPLCVFFDRDGNVSLSNQTGPNVCTTTRHGHFCLVVETPFRGKVSKWQIVTVSTVGGALGASLLSLLVIAMCVKAKKKARMDELERRAYEEEALQVSMVGHVRAVRASGTRTLPTIEHHHDYRK